MATACTKGNKRFSRPLCKICGINRSWVHIGLDHEGSLGFPRQRRAWELSNFIGRLRDHYSLAFIEIRERGATG